MIKARAFLQLIGQKERRLGAPQARDGDLTNLSLVAAEPDTFIQVTDVLVTAVRSIDDRLAPG